MSLVKNSVIFGTLALISKVSAHGIVTGVVSGGKYFLGYDPSFQYQQTPPEVAGWTAPLTQDRGFVDPPSYGSPDIICHKGATPGKGYIQVSAGGTIELQWTEWPESHHGPMIDYLAPCGDDCTTVDKTSLRFTKIDEAGLNEWVTMPGDWASDDMIRNNNSWVTTIPSSIAPGKYVLRHETIALHAANNANGAQNYPQCMNIEVSGSGTNTLASGTLATDLYSANDPGILVNIYQKLSAYIIPGPAVMEGGSSGSPAPEPSASSSTPADVSVTATPTTGIAIPTGEPSFPPYPIPANSTGPAPTGSSSVPAASQSQSQSHPWADWSYTGTFTKPTTAVAIPTESSAEVPADTSAPAPTGGAGGNGGSTGGDGETDGDDEDDDEEEEEYPEEPETPAPATTSPPTSFSSTVTGRIGKPTKFVCYLEED